MKAVKISIASCLLVALAATSCDSSTGSGDPDSEPPSAAASATETRSARPTLTDRRLQPPSQDNKYTRSSGRPQVVFDPCTWMDAADVESVGFRSDSRKRGTDLVAEYTFLTCSFDNPGNTLALGLDSGNITWEENLQKNGSWLEPTTINGRRAGWGTGAPGTTDECNVQMETKAGVVLTWVRVQSLGKNKGLDPCANIMEIASVVEKSIGKEN